MKAGDLVRYGGIPGCATHPGCLGVLLRRLQYHSDSDNTAWDGDPAWWIQFVNDAGPTWSYDIELTLVKKGN